ncbi:MAG: VCBS repeat-containing protein [Salinivirgaceae bacterium]|nr:VCBS repeat-containing protein [Salinivirgaceae bacterium]
MKNLIPIIICIILLAFISDTPKIQQFSLSIFAWSSYSTDLNLDGYNDIAVGHKTAWERTNQTVSFLYGNGNDFAPDTNYLNFCGYQDAIFAIKVNNDAYPDIICQHSDLSGNMAQRYIRVIYNQSGVFDLDSILDINLNTSEIVNYYTHGDINGDGWQDIVIASNNGYFWGVLFNDTQGSFLEPEYHFTDGYITMPGCGDINNDDKDEIFVPTTGKTLLFGYINGLVLFDTISTPFGIPFFCDFDNDFDNDIVCYDRQYPLGIVMHFYENINNDSLFYNQRRDIILNHYGNQVEIADLNNDNLPDLILD